MEPFFEEQRVRGLYLVYIIAAIFLAALAIIIPAESKIALIPVAAVALFVMFATTFLLRYKSSIDNAGISVRSWLNRTLYKRVWDEIKSISIHHYKPIKQFGYSGFRNRRFVNQVINLNNKTCMLIVHKDGTTMLIGTRNEASLQNYLDYLKAKNNIAAIEG